MEKEEYKEALKLIDKKIEDLKNQKKELEQAFIDENAEFQVGEKVLVTNSQKIENVAFVKSISVSSNGEIKYKFVKAKKDGTASLNGLWVSMYAEIKPFNQTS